MRKKRRKCGRFFRFENIVYYIGIAVADLLSEKSRIKGLINYVQKKISGSDRSIKRVTSKNNVLSEKIIDCNKYSIKDNE
ncbi:hypothetical protein KAJ27_21570 [bacterium]|nr:hypothetical protein [bacterium]